MSASDANQAGEHLLDRLRAASARRPEMLSSAVFGQALRIAELLIGQPDPTAGPQACSEILRSAAMTLAASKHSFSVTHDPGRPPAADDALAVQHYDRIAQCLLFMADTLSPQQQQTSAVADVVDMDSRRSRAQLVSLGR